ncbi:MAG: 2-polyprenyl-6-methoxyphenol hydroxylase [Rhodococcus sp. (in: high G+C Gram-positive bacteria)]|nr:MAG: 2-polyprenyl-6-methoxyphenol hydroxylase [Rhodococcus sp. (in: high G+C Gram-positive bacteria)]
MPAVHHVLVVGGGVAGAASATLLAAAGVPVDLIEIKPDVTALGSGITLQGNALRVLDHLGILGECISVGHPFTTLTVRAPDAEGTVLTTINSAPTGGPGVPPTMGMYRPDLARILMARAEQAGVKTRFSTTITTLTQRDNGVDVRFSDGTSTHYDLVIAADGLRSPTRRMLGVQLETRSTGLGIWRVFAPRPAEVTGAELLYGGNCYYSGYTPTSWTTLYAHLTEDAQDRSALTPEEKIATVHELSAGYHGPWDEIRDSLDDATIHYTWAETHLLDAPWNRGRVVLIGDASHTCPPTIAQGAAMGLEDSLVLSELLIHSDRVDEGLWEAFGERRYDRVKTVVDASNQLAQWQLDRVSGDVPALMARIAELVSVEP